eukprot:Skav214908  [mRNA]  locus=scaffold3783:17685:35924:- [translate_table: standard]
MAAVAEYATWQQPWVPLSLGNGGQSVQYLVEAECRFLLFAHHHAVMDTMQQTLEKMKAPDIGRDTSETPLMTAVRLAIVDRCCELLVKGRVDPGRSDLVGETPLMEAKRLGMWVVSVFLPCLTATQLAEEHKAEKTMEERQRLADLRREKQVLALRRGG